MVLITHLLQTSKRMAIVSRLRTIWHHAYITQVLLPGLPLPFPQTRTPSLLSAISLEHIVRRSLRIGKFWSSKNTKPTQTVVFRASEATNVTDVRFLPGRGGRYVVTVSKGIWSVITCWDVGCEFDVATFDKVTVPGGARKVAEWCPKGAIFSGFIVNSDPSSDGVLAISVNTGGLVLKIQVQVQFIYLR